MKESMYTNGFVSESMSPRFHLLSSVPGYNFYTHDLFFFLCDLEKLSLPMTLQIITMVDSQGFHCDVAVLIFPVESAVFVSSL